MKDQPNGAASDVQLRQAIFDQIGLPGSHAVGEAAQFDLDGAATALVQSNDPATPVVGRLQPGDLHRPVV